MEIDAQDYLNKALVDSQERVRNFMSYSNHFKDEKLRNSFKKFALQEGYIAQEIQSILNKSDRGLN